jgi:excisionase family DNA binding protein
VTNKLQQFGLNLQPAARVRRNCHLRPHLVLRGDHEKNEPLWVEESKQLLTVKQVAKLLRVCNATVYKLCDRGELAHARILNAIRVIAMAWNW